MLRLPPVRSLALAALLLSAVTAQKPATPVVPKPGKAIEIVFVGNSYTHFHDLPAMVQALGRAQQPPREVTTVMLAPGGFTWQQHWAAEGADAPRTVLREKRPDFVVLQEQSRRPLDEPKAMHEVVPKLAKLVKDCGAQPVWYMTWARQAEPEAQDRITAEYGKAWQTGGGLLAPVGRAWQLALAHKGQRLHSDDGSHPNPGGSYLAACVLYATMCGGDVARFPDKLVLPAANGKERVLVDLPADEGKRLRAAAAQALTPAAKK
jgi:hypothetical protein